MKKIFALLILLAGTARAQTPPTKIFGLEGIAGSGALSLGSMTGATTLPTGNLSWTGAATKTLSLVGPSTFTLTGGATSTWSLSAGALTISTGSGSGNNITQRSGVTMSGSATGFIFDTTNTMTAGDTHTSWRNGTVEFMALAQGTVTGSNKTLTLTGVSSNTASGPLIVESFSAASLGVSLTLDASTNAGGGERWNLWSTNGGAAVFPAGTFALYDATVGKARVLATTAGGLVVGAQLISVVYPGSPLDVLKNNVVETTAIGASVFNDQPATSAGAEDTQRSPVLDIAGHVWNTTTPADNFAAIGLQMVPTMGATPTTQLDLYRYVGASNTRTYTNFMTFFDSGLAKIKRLTQSFGTSLAAGDFTLSAGWGSTASIGSLSGTDGDWVGTITTAGITLSANPTLVLTFKDGTWTTAPVCVLNMSTTSDATNTITKITWTTTATALTITFNGTPLVTNTYVFNSHCIGVQ